MLAGKVKECNPGCYSNCADVGYHYLNNKRKIFEKVIVGWESDATNPSSLCLDQTDYRRECQRNHHADSTGLRRRHAIEIKIEADKQRDYR